MKRWNTLLNILMGSFAGVFLGHGIYVVWEFKTHPERYVMQSAPWYTSILVYGIVTAGVLLFCVVVKAIIRHRKK